MSSEWNFSIRYGARLPYELWAMKSNSWNSTKPYVGLDLTLTPPLSFTKFISLEYLWERGTFAHFKRASNAPILIQLYPLPLHWEKAKNRIEGGPPHNSEIFWPSNQSHKCHLLTTSTYSFRWLPANPSIKYTVGLVWIWQRGCIGGDSGHTLAGNHSISVTRSLVNPHLAKIQLTILTN